MSFNDDNEFINQYEHSIYEQDYKKSRVLLLIIAFVLFSILIWTYFAKIDEVTRGVGVVIASEKNKIVQNLEGGIVEEILIKEGDEVKKNQALIKIKNQGFESVFSEAKMSIDELNIQIKRLEAELEKKEFILDDNIIKKNPQIANNQKGIYESNLKFLKNQMEIYDEKIKQMVANLNKTKINIKFLNKKAKILKEQIDISKPLVERQIESKSDFLKLEQEQVGIKEKIEIANSSLPEIQSQINELKNKKQELEISFKSRVQKELNENLTKLSSLSNKQKTFKDQVTRTLVKSPINGTIKQIYVNTIGQVIKPAMDLVEIVPTKDSLLIEARIKPQDIAFIKKYQQAMVKVSAYDFSIYGGLKGEVVRISADTLKDEKNQTYFLVEIKTKKTNLGTKEKPLRIMPGMTVSVDIITGKKSILSYILKPVLKAKHNALTER